MADVVPDTEQIKAVVQGASAWMPVISTLAGGILAGGVALLVSRVNHRYAREREAAVAAERLRHEQQITEDKRQKELFYVATERYLCWNGMLRLAPGLRQMTVRMMRHSSQRQKQ